MAHGVPPVQQGVNLVQSGVHQVSLVVLPTRLIFLRTAMVVDGEQHGSGRFGRAAEVERRLSAPGSDLDKRSRKGVNQRCPTGPQGSTHEGLALVVRHEAARPAGHVDD